MSLCAPISAGAIDPVGITNISATNPRNSNARNDRYHNRFDGFAFHLTTNVMSISRRGLIFSSSSLTVSDDFAVFDLLAAAVAPFPALSPVAELPLPAPSPVDGDGLDHHANAVLFF